MRLAFRKLSGLVNHSTEPSSRVDTPPGRRSCFRHRKRPRLWNRGLGSHLGEVSTSSCWKRPAPFFGRKSRFFLGERGGGENQLSPQLFWITKFHRRLFKTKPLLSFSLKELGLLKLRIIAKPRRHFMQGLEPSTTSMSTINQKFGQETKLFIAGVTCPSFASAHGGIGEGPTTKDLLLRGTQSHVLATSYHEKACSAMNGRNCERRREDLGMDYDARGCVRTWHMCIQLVYFDVYSCMYIYRHVPTYLHRYKYVYIYTYKYVYAYNIHICIHIYSTCPHIHALFNSGEVQPDPGFSFRYSVRSIIDSSFFRRQVWMQGFFHTHHKNSFVHPCETPFKAAGFHG